MDCRRLISDGRLVVNRVVVVNVVGCSVVVVVTLVVNGCDKRSAVSVNRMAYSLMQRSGIS